MRCVVQRVSKASVVICGNVHASIGAGLVVLAAFHAEDDDAVIRYMADKLLGLRIFSDAEDKLNLSVQDVGGEILLISNFTVYGETKKGKRPNFSNSASYATGEKIYHDLIRRLESIGAQIKTGVYGADMQVELMNDGPVTVILERNHE